MTTNACSKRSTYPEIPPVSDVKPEAAQVKFEFGCFRLLLRQRQLLADGEPIELGTRAFEILLVLLEADGSLVTKDELLSRVWPGTAVAEDNLKVQMSALRKALGENRDFIRTEFGRGYRFTAEVRSRNGHQPTRRLTRRRICRRWPHRWFVRADAGYRFGPGSPDGCQILWRLIASARCKEGQR
jgi:DNA-binding winged helix-turn-helix (wHTH) protein